MIAFYIPYRPGSSYRTRNMGRKTVVYRSKNSSHIATWCHTRVEIFVRVTSSRFKTGIGKGKWSTYGTR